jgi:hypothetical protein
MLKYPLWDVSQGAFDEFVEIQGYNSLGVNHVAMQGSAVTLWSLGDMAEAKIKRRFRIVGTGQDVPVGDYLGTVHDRAYVWHIFEVFYPSYGA